MESGTICGLRLDRGFLFIRPDAGGKDVFCHFSALGEGLEFTERLREQRVQFDVYETDRGPKAASVRPVQD